MMVCIGGEPETAMAGLNCGEPNFVNYPYLMSRTDAFIKCSDAVTYTGMLRHDACFFQDTVRKSRLAVIDVCYYTEISNIVFVRIHKCILLHFPLDFNDNIIYTVNCEFCYKTKINETRSGVNFNGKY